MFCPFASRRIEALALSEFIDHCNIMAVGHILYEKDIQKDSFSVWQMFRKGCSYAPWDLNMYVDFEDEK